MTVDLFAASFICRDAELGAVWQLGSREPRDVPVRPAGRPALAAHVTAALQALGTAWRRTRARPA